MAPVASRLKPSAVTPASVQDSHHTFPRGSGERVTGEPLKGSFAHTNKEQSIWIPMETKSS